MDANELISSKILSDVEIIADIYNIVKAAGLAATNNPTVKSKHNDVCVLKPYQVGRTRLTEECRKTREYSIKYDANDITIVGGAALNVYDYKLRELKERRELEALDNYIKKKTSDIDIVWWPRSVSNKEIITSKSEAIIQLAQAFREELQQKFNDAANDLDVKVKPYISNISNADELSIYVEMFQTRPAGVFNINVQFRIKDKILKICDISLHDSGAGQRYDADGNEITTMQFMTEDPVYCSPNTGNMNSITYLNVKGIDIGVSNIHAFVNQQMLAFDNLIRVQNSKSLINYKRVEFVKKLLHSFKLRNERDRQNYAELFEVFGTRHADYPAFIIGEIDKRVYSSMIKLYKPILALCETINTVNDKIVGELCINARIAEDTDTHSKNNLDMAERFAAIEQSRLQDLKEQVGRKKRLSPQKYKKDYAAIYDNLESKRISIQKMLASEILEYKAKYESGTDEDIEEMIRIDNIIKREQDAFAAQSRKKVEAPAAPPPATPPSFIPTFHQVSSVPYGYAPRYPPPTLYSQYYVEPSTGRHIQYDPRGFWYYLAPPPPLLPRPGQPPLPHGSPPPAPGQRFIIHDHRPYQLPGSYRRGGTRKNIQRDNKTRKNI